MNCNILDHIIFDSHNFHTHQFKLRCKKNPFDKNNEWHSLSASLNFAKLNVCGKIEIKNEGTNHAEQPNLNSLNALNSEYDKFE